MANKATFPVEATRKSFYKWSYWKEMRLMKELLRLG